MNRLSAALPLLLLAACSKEQDPAPQATLPGESVAQATAVATASQKTATATATATAAAGQGLSVSEEGRLFSFSYSYPAEAGAIPALKAQLDGEKDKARAALIASARDGQKDARDNGFQYHRYERSVDWSVVTNLPGWLSLLGAASEFTGGAHPNSSSIALLWDKAANQPRDPVSLFTSKEAFNTALGAAYCTALNTERTKRREEPVLAGSGNEFDKCLPPAEVTVLLGSGDKAHFTRVRLIADPYAAGPYVEGSYEVTVPVTPALVAAVRPEYRNAFAVGR